MKSSVFIIVLFLFYFNGLSQCFDVDLILPEKVCTEQNFTLVNDTGFEGKWNFCANDVLQTEGPQKIVSTIPNTGRIYGVEILRIDNNFYGFFVGRANKIYRINFSAKIDNNYTVTELAPLNSPLLNEPLNIEIIQKEGIWSAYIANYGGKNILKLEFGTDLLNLSPQLSVFQSLPSYSIFDLEVVEIENTHHIFTVAFSSNIIKSIKIGNDGNASVFGDIVVTEASDFRYLTIKNVCDEIYLFSSDFTKNNVFKVKLKSDLLTVDNSMVVASATNPLDLKFVQLDARYLLIFQTRNGSIYRADFGSNINSTPTVNELVNAKIKESDVFGLTLYQEADSVDQHILSIESNKREFFDISFSNDCYASMINSYSEAVSISYSAPGTYPITLTAYDEEGNSSSITKEITVTDNIAPSIDFAQETQCISNAITFTTSSTQTLTAQTWDFGDGTTATGAEVSHQYTEPGTYKVLLTVESENGCGNFIEKEVNIYAAPEPDFSFAAVSICTNGAVVFENTTPGEYKEEDITWHWDFGDGTSSEEKSPSHTYTTGGTKTVKLTASIPGCTETQEYHVTVMEGPSVNFVADYLCFGDVVQFTNLSAGDGITSFAWDFGNGETSTDENPVMEFDAAGEYEVSLTVSNAIGCSNTFTETIKINALPAVSFENAMACTGAGTLFQDKSTVANGSIAAWEWRFGDGGASTDRNPTHTFTEAGSYEVTLIVTSVAGCIDSVKQTVDVNLAPIADFEVELGCPGALTQFTNTSEDPAGDGIEVNYWIINGIYHYTPNPAVLFTKAGTYGVTLAVTSGSSCKSIVTKNIVVDPLPTPDFSFENACVGAATSFRDQSIAFGDDEIAVWNWEFGNFETSNEQNPEVVFPGEGNYAVTLTVTTARGCSAIINKTVTISSLPEAAFAPQNNFGGPPLEVQFSNNSTGAVSYQWHFGDAEGSTSVDAEPVFVYTEVGEYEVELIATNAGGCSDTARFTVSVLISEVDVVLERINVYTNTGNMQVVLSIRNQGTVPVENMNIKLDLGGKISLNERFTGSIAPGSSYNYPLGFDILAEDLPGVGYICASLEVAGITKEEVNRQDNSACHDIKGTFLLTEPHPNPVDQMLNIEYFMPDDEPARFVLSDMLGNAVLDFQEGKARKGLNKFSYDFSHLAAGMYVLQISHKETSFIRRLVVQ